MTHPELPGLPERYRLGEVLGTGGFGRVLKARDVVLDRDVAVKVMRDPARDAESRRRFRREAQVTARVRHPHVVAVFDSGLLADGSPYMVYEFVPGRSLEVATPVEVGPLLAVATALADALAAIHAAGAVHRDVKPANVLLRRPGDPVLLDLGIVRIDKEGTPFTPEGILLGTPSYMAPELFAGGDASPASDQFAWAATLLHAAEGSVYQEGDLRGILGELKKFDPGPRLPDALPRSLRGILVRALQAEPGTRFPDMGAVGRALRDIAARSRNTSDERPVDRTVPLPEVSRRLAATPVGLPAPTTRRLRGRRRTPAPALVAIGATAVAIGYFLHAPGSPPESAQVPVAPPAPPPSLDRELALVFPPGTPPEDATPDSEAYLRWAYARAVHPEVPRALSRALRVVERWVAARTAAQRSRPGAAVFLDQELDTLGRELDGLHVIEERLRRETVGSLLAEDPFVLDGWDREDVRHLYLVVRAMVDASLCRMETSSVPPGSFYPALVLRLAKPLELLHGGGDAVACEEARNRGARAFRILLSELDQVPHQDLGDHAHMARVVSSIEADFQVLPSAEQAAGLDRIEQAIAARLSGQERRVGLVETLVRRSGLIRDSPTEDQAARLAEARAALARLAQQVPEALGELPDRVNDDDRRIFSAPPAYDAFLADVRAAAKAGPGT